MSKDYTVFLRHILESIEAIEEYITDISEEEFLENRQKQDAIIRRLEIIGEAVRNLPEEFQKQYAFISWNKVMGLRNILIHHYFGIDLEIIWDTVTKSLPQFKEQIKSLLGKEEKNFF